MGFRQMLGRLLGGDSAMVQRAAAPAAPEGLERFIHCSMSVPTRPPNIYPTLGALLAAAPGSFVPAALVAQKAKSVSDGVLAALEELSTLGPERVEAALEIAARGATSRPSAFEFLRDPIKSKPLGFYSWSEALERAFRRDRFLQEPLEEDEAAAIANELGKDARLLAGYSDHLRRTARLTDCRTKKTADLETRVAVGARARSSRKGRKLYSRRARRSRTSSVQSRTSSAR